MATNATSAEAIEAELAIKTNLVEALNAENEQLRFLLQKHADAADARAIEQLPSSDMRRESNANELRSVIAHMRTQLYERVNEHDSANATVAQLRAENAGLKNELQAVKAHVIKLEEQLKYASSRYTEERQKVLNLRAGMEESKRAISIMKDQLDRRNSVVQIHDPNNSRRTSETVARKGSINLSNVSEARRGSLNYLTGLGLTSKRLNHFDPRKQALMGNGNTSEGDASENQNAFNPRASLPASAAARRQLVDSDPPTPESPTSIRRRASLPATSALRMGPAATFMGQAGRQANTPDDAEDASSPHFATTSRRSSITASRRNSLNPESPNLSGIRRSGSLVQALQRFGAAQELDATSRRGSTTIIDEEAGDISSSTDVQGSNLTSMPEVGVRRRASASLLIERRRSSAQCGSALRRGSEKPLPRIITDLKEMGGFMEADPSQNFVSSPLALAPSTLAEEEDGLASPTGTATTRGIGISSAGLRRGSSFPPAETEGVVQALSLEAAMEISDLKEVIAVLKMQLMEAEESREASEAVARALREFIASSESTGVSEKIKLPPLPSDSETDSGPDAEAEAAKRIKEEKRSSRWGMPKLLPSLSYSGIRRDASSSIANHLPPLSNKVSDVKDSNTSGGDCSNQLNVPPNPIRQTKIRSQSESIAAPDANGSPRSNFFLKQPEWRKTANLRSSVASGMSETSTSGAPSPILSMGLPGFQSSFSGFSFAATQERRMEELEEPPSPMGSRNDSPTFESSSSLDGHTSSSSMDESSECESLPDTPSDVTFGDRIESEQQVKDKLQAEREAAVLDPTMTPRAPQMF